MAHSLTDLLSRKDFDEPPEIQSIKAYVITVFQADIEVMVRERDIVLITSSAPLANNLRLHLADLRDVAGTNKKIVIRIR